MATLVLNGFNIGQDISVVIIDDQGNQVAASQLGHLMEIDAAATDTELDIVPITNGGVPILETIPRGWNGRMTFTRVNGALQNIWNTLEALFFDQGIRVSFSIMCTIQNRDGSQDIYTFVGVKFSKQSFGNWRADKEVDMTLTFRASRILTQNGAAALLA